MAPNARRRRAPVIRRRKRMPDSGDARFPRQRRFTRFLKLSNQTSSSSKVRWVELVAGPRFAQGPPAHSLGSTAHFGRFASDLESKSQFRAECLAEHPRALERADSIGGAVKCANLGPAH